MKRLSDYLVYLAVRLVLSVVQILPVSACERLSKMLAYLAADVFRFRASLVDENLSYAFPELSADQRRTIARQMWEHLALMTCELALVPRKIHDTNWRKYITSDDFPLMMRYLVDERPKVFVSGHFGNFEMGSVTMGLFGFPSYAVARELDNPYLERLIRSVRELKGQFLLPKDGSAVEIQRVLQAGRILMLLGDQHAGKKGIWIDFLGRPASCHKALALFTLSSNAPMLVSYCRRRGGMMRFHVGVSAIADPRTMSEGLKNVRSLTQWFNDYLAAIVQAEPDQYWWVHRRWKSPSSRHRIPQSPAAAA